MFCRVLCLVNRILFCVLVAVKWLQARLWPTYSLSSPLAPLHNAAHPTGECAGVIAATSCKDATTGEGRLAACISQLIAAAEARGDGKGGDSKDDDEEEAADVPDKCQEEVYAFYIKRAKNVNANVPLARACKADAEKLCDETWFFGGGEGKVLACLR